MLRRSLQAVFVVVGLASLVEGSRCDAAHHQRGGVVNYLGGWGPGPFGHGDFSYAGYTSHTVQRHREAVPSFTTRFSHR